MSAATGDMLERRTVDWLEKVGYRAERVSRRSRHRGGDLFACIDLVAYNEAEVIFVQVTTKGGASARRRKIRDAKLPVPVRLFRWFKDERGRWVFLSEEVLS